MTDWGLPGLQARYEFVQAGEQVELRLDLRFDPATPGLTRTARNVWLELRDRLAPGAGDDAPPATVSLVTSVASAPLTVTADGTGLNERFVDFVSQFAALPPETDAPVVAALTFHLPKAGAADLKRDIFELDVRLEIWPVPIAIGMPKLDEDRDEVAFAAAFEEAWQGFDGAGSRIALAAEDRPEGAALWCVKAGAASGIALAAPAQAHVAYYGVPPLSTVLLSGTIAGDQGTEQFTAIDLDSWWDSFALGIDRVAAATGPGEMGDRFKRVRAALADHLAGRLRPVADREPGDGLAEVRTVFGAAARADLRCRAVASATVDVRRGAALSGEPAAVLHGRAMTWVEEASAVAASPAAVRLIQGRQHLAYAVPESGEEGPRRPSPIRFEADRIERQDDIPLRLLLPAPVVTDLLGVDLERPSTPAPLIRAPAPPDLSVAARALGDSASVGDALAWSVEVEARARFAAQDRLELALGFDEEVEGPSPESPAPNGPLFEALGRAVQAAASLPAELAAIERFAALAEGVAEALPGWTPPVAKVAPLPGKWRYAVDFRDRLALIVSRETQESGPLPPWPAITGFVTPASEEGSARYEPDPGAATDSALRLSFTGLRLLADRSVRVHARTSRNANLVDSVGPAFVYPGTIESTSDLRPRLEWQAPQPEPRTERLEAALTALLHAIDEQSRTPYVLGLEAALLRPVEMAGTSIENRIPLLPLPGIEMGGEDGSAVAELAHELAGALSAVRAGLGPEAPGEKIALTVTLFDREPERLLLARLDVRIAVPGDESWWGDPRRGFRFS